MILFGFDLRNRLIILVVECRIGFFIDDIDFVLLLLLLSRRGVLVVVVQPASISSSVEHTQSLTQNNTDPMSFTQTGVETPGRRGHRLRAENADNSRDKRWIERHPRGRSRGNGFTRVFERDDRGRER